MTANAANRAPPASECDGRHRSSPERDHPEVFRTYSTRFCTSTVDRETRCEKLQ